MSTKTYHHRSAFGDYAIDLTGAADLSPSRPMVAFREGSAEYARMQAELAATPPQATLVED